MRTKLLLIIALISTFGVLSQNLGDYRSKGSGPVAWNLASSWEVYDGTSWVDATNYPGLINGTYNANIRAGHIITMLSNINNQPNTFGTLTIDGQLQITNNQDAYLNATAVLVTENLGSILFSGQANLYLPANTALTVFPDGIITGNNCSNSQRIYIGTIYLASCLGSGNGPMLSFDELQNTNGSLTGVLDIDYQCTTAKLIPRHVGLITGTNRQFRMIVKNVANTTILDTGLNTYNPSNLSEHIIDIATDGIFKVELTFKIEYTNGFYENTRHIDLYTFTKWDGSGWIPSYLSPDLKIRTVLDGNYNTGVNGSFSTCNLRINNGVTLSVAENTHVTIENNIVNNGTITVENSGSLVQNNDDSTFSGNNITVKRTSRPMKLNDYVYWGSPVQENVIAQIPTLFDKKFRWQAGANYNWFDLTTTTPNPGNGFITRYRNPDPTIVAPTAITFTFTGKPNNGVVTVPVSFVDNVATNYGNYNLLANPYPSGISAAKFIEANASMLSGTIHFWTSTSTYSGTGEYSVMDYATWNSSGSSSPPANDPLNNALTPNGTIASGQGIFVQAKANGTVVFNNAMRKNDQNNQFFRTLNEEEGSKSSTSEGEKNRLWLLLTNNNGLFRNIMVGYIDGATNGFEDKYDGISFTSNSIDFYSIVKDKNLAIQGRALPFTKTDVVALGYKTNLAGTYTLQINGQDGFFEKGFPVYVHDKTNNTYHNLRKGAFSFITAAGTFNNRFGLVYNNNLNVASSKTITENQVLTYGFENSIYVVSKEWKIKEVEVYDVLGKLLLSNTPTDTYEFTAELQNKSKSFLIIKTVLENNTTDSQKIILH